MKSPILLAALAACSAAAAPAAAQLSQNSKAPVDITADQAEALNAECVSTWTGNVEALQETSRLKTDALKVFVQKDGRPAKSSGSNATGGCGGEITRMEAHGSVYYVTPQQKVRGDDAVYEAGSNTIVMTGDVVAAQGQNVVRGTRMVVNVETGQGSMTTGVKGQNKPGRVRGVFYPNKDQNQPAGASAAGK